MLTAGSIISDAFRVLRTQPKVFAIWAILYFVATVAVSLAMRPMMAAAMAGNGSAIGSIFLRMLPFQLLMLLILLVLFNAAQRAVLRSGEGARTAYLRLGMDELRTFLLGLILAVIIYAALIVIMLLGAAVIGGLSLALGIGGASVGMVAVILLLLPFLIWLEVRLSLAFPLTLLRRKIIIGESWRLTRGHFWTLFGAYLAIFLIVMVVSVIVSALTAGSYWMAIVQDRFNPQAMNEAAQAQLARQFGPIGVITVIGWIASALAGTLMIAIGAGSIAAATRGLVVDNDAIAETFA